MFDYSVKGLWVGPHEYDIVLHEEHYLGTAKELVDDYVSARRYFRVTSRRTEEYPDGQTMDLPNEIAVVEWLLKLHLQERGV